MSRRLIAVAASALFVLAACSGDDSEARTMMDATWGAMSRSDQQWLCDKSHDERRAALDEIGGGVDNGAAAKRLDELCAALDIMES